MQFFFGIFFLIGKLISDGVAVNRANKRADDAVRRYMENRK